MFDVLAGRRAEEGDLKEAFVGLLIVRSGDRVLQAAQRFENVLTIQFGACDAGVTRLCKQG